MKNVKKERSGGLGGVFIAALFSVTLGVLLAFLALINQPVQELTRRPEEPDIGKVYYLKGNVIDTPQWSQRLSQVKSGASGSFAFTEGDLNAWAKQNLRPTPTTAKTENPPIIKVTDFPNLRVTENDRLQVMLRVEAPMLRPGRPYTYQAFGELTSEGYKPTKGWLGQAPLPFINGLVFNYLSRAMDVSDNAVDLAERIGDARVVIDNGQVIVHR